MIFDFVGFCCCLFGVIVCGLRWIGVILVSVMVGVVCLLGC